MADTPDTALAIRTESVCRRLVIRNPTDARQANTLVHDISAERRRLDAERKAEKAPALAECRRIDAKHNALIKRYDAAERALKDAIARYMRETATVHTQHLQAAAAAHVAGDHSTAMAHVAVANQAAADGLPLEGTGVRWTWVGNVVDPAAVRRELCSPDDAKIRELVVGIGDAQPPPEPGIQWERKPIVTVRHNGKHQTR